MTRLYHYLFELKVRAKNTNLPTFTRNLALRWKGSPDHLPIPPAHLMYVVMGSTDVHDFLESGRVHSHSIILGPLEKNGYRFEKFQDVLDFGCGCGRIIRTFTHFSSVSLHGTDINPKLVGWCTDNLPFACFSVNTIEPPLDFEPGSFDFIYARSVFTHLPEELQIAWLNEFFRLLRPTGVFLFTTHGATYASLLNAEEERIFLSGTMVIRNSMRAGTNDCAVFHPEQWVRRQLRQARFRFIDFIEGRKEKYLYQDIYIAEKPSQEKSDIFTE